MIQAEQGTGTGFERYLDKYGWPTLILILIGILLRAAWPFVRDYVAGLQKATLDAFTLMRERLDAAEKRAEDAHSQFLTALEGQRRTHEDAMRIQSEGQIKTAEIAAKASELQATQITGAVREQTATIKEVRETLKALTEQVQRNQKDQK